MWEAVREVFSREGVSIWRVEAGVALQPPACGLFADNNLMDRPRLTTVMFHQWLGFDVGVLMC